MKVLFLTEHFPPEGNAAATRIYERACYWVKWGHEVTVITCAPNFPQGKIYPGYQNKWHQVEDMNGIRVVRVKTFIAANDGNILRILDFVSFMITSVIAGFFEKKPAVVVASSPQFFAAVGGWLLSVMRRVPFIFELADLWPASIIAVGAMRDNIFLRWMEKLELFIYRQSAAVVALTQAFKTDLVRRKIPENKIEVIINGVDLPRYSPRSRDSSLSAQWKLEGHFVVGYIGTQGMSHALENVLHAALLLKDEPNIRFLFVGTGAAAARLIDTAQKMSLDNVVFIPPQPKALMPNFWSLCNVALVHLKNTPVFETVIPSKIFEAMGMGLPILLAAPDGEVSRIVKQEKVGIHVPPENPQALAQAVQQLKNNTVAYREYVERSLAAAPCYTRERQAREMLTVLDSVTVHSSEGMQEGCSGNIK